MRPPSLISNHKGIPSALLHNVKFNLVLHREIANAGHFLHRDQPADVTAHILDWFGRG